MNTQYLQYHGWIVLATSADDWDDGMWEEAIDKVRQLLVQLSPEKGHSGLVPPSDMGWQLVYLDGLTVDSIAPPLEVMTKIVKVCDASFGELVVLHGPDAPSVIERYRLADKKLMKYPMFGPLA